MGKKWAPEQVAYFEESWGTISLATIAKKLGKTVKAVDVWRRRNGFTSNTEANGNVPIYEFAAAVGRDPQSIYRGWIKDNGLPVKVFKPKDKLRKKMINIDDFWEWAWDHKTFIDFTKIEPGVLGKEPNWVKEQRKTDLNDSGKKGWDRPWTSEEDTMLLNYLKSMRYTYRQISEVIGRSELGIQIRLHELGIKLRPIPEPRRNWTKDEVSTLLSLVDSGQTLLAISKKLNRGQLQLKAKIHRLKKKKMAV